MSRSAFERIPMSADAQRDYLDAELDRMRDFIQASKEGDGLTVKRLEGALLRAEERLKAKLDSRQGPRHHLRGHRHRLPVRRRSARLQEPAHPVQHPRRRDRRVHARLRPGHEDQLPARAATAPGSSPSPPPPRSPTASPKPTSCSTTCGPTCWQAAGIADFDSWAATFGQTVTQIEMAPEGGNSFRQKTRFAKFTNVPEMLRRWHVSADIKTGEDLKLPVPALARRPADGQRAPETVITQPSDAQLDIMTAARRARRRDPQPAGAARRRQHAQGLHRRPQGRPRPAPARPAHDHPRQDRGRRRPDRRALASPPRRHLPGPGRPGRSHPRQPAARLLRHRHAQR